MPADTPTRDAEAAWPLTAPDPGYYPGTAPSAHPGLMPFAPGPVYPPAPAPTSAPRISPGMRVAYLAIILGVAIPLTAIAGTYAGLIGMGLAWVGIVLVAALAFGRTNGR